MPDRSSCPVAGPFCFEVETRDRPRVSCGCHQCRQSGFFISHLSKFPFPRTGSQTTLPRPGDHEPCKPAHRLKRPSDRPQNATGLADDRAEQGIGYELRNLVQERSYAFLPQPIVLCFVKVKKGLNGWIRNICQNLLSRIASISRVWPQVKLR